MEHNPFVRIEERFDQLERLIREATNQKPPELPRPAPPSDFKGIKEVANLLNTTVNAVYQLVHQRKIPYYKKGKRLFFKLSEINQWLESGRTRTSAEIIADSTKSITSKSKLS